MSDPEPRDRTLYLEKLFPVIVTPMRAKFAEIDENSDGVLSRDELRKFHEHAGQHLSEEMLIKEFDELDANHDGVVSFDEYLRSYVVAHLREDPKTEEVFPHDRVTELFTETDENGDGRLDKTEIARVLMKMAQGDVGEDGEMPTEDQMREEVEEVWGLADKNGDGVVDWAEFLEWMKILWFLGKSQQESGGVPPADAGEPPADEPAAAAAAADDAE